MLLASLVALSVAPVPSFDRFVSEALRAYKVPGAAVVVIEDGKVAMVKGFGYRDIAAKTRVDANTVFQLASVTKAFTGTLAGSLVDSGKLNLDKPIKGYLPAFEYVNDYVTEHMTMRDLLAMRTGWPAFDGDLLGQLGYSRSQVLERLRYFKPKYTFREVATYSNPGFFVAGEVEAAVGGASWDELMKRRIFQPLGMTRSGTRHADLSRPNTSRNYAMVDGKVTSIPPIDHDVLGPAGSVCSSVTDLSKWMSMLLNEGSYRGRRVLKPETVEAIFARSMVAGHTMAEMPPISEDTGFYYGLGFGSFDYAGTRVMEKGGAIAGVRTIVVLVPSRRSGIAVLSNMNFTAFPEAVRAEWLSRVLRQGDGPANAKAIFAANAAMQKMFAVPPPPKNPKPPKIPVDSLLGVYENDLYGRFEVARTPKGLLVYAGPGRSRGTLKRLDGDTYSLKWPVVTSGADDVRFVVGPGGRVSEMVTESFGTFNRR